MARVLQYREELTEPTPMMKQYLDIKERYVDYILMYRLGDFFECFFEDALTVSEKLELTLTGRECGNNCRAVMCGVPFHKSDVYIGKLVELGYKVAVCEQTEDPAQAVGLVKRDVVRIVTPGTVTDGELLSDKRNNYLAAFCFDRDGTGAAFADISTGQMYVTFLTNDDLEAKLHNEITTYLPKEALFNGSSTDYPHLRKYLFETCGTIITDKKDLFDPENARTLATACFGGTAENIKEPAALSAVGAALSYIRETQKCDPTFMKELFAYRSGQFMELDFNTRRNLELTESMRTKEKKGSLLWVLDRTQTAMGGRLLHSFVVKPLLSQSEILSRQGAVTGFVNDYLLREETKNLLSGVMDIERLTAKAVYGTANARDLKAIGKSLTCLPALKEKLALCKDFRMKELTAKFDTLSDLFDLLDKAFVENPPLTVREGGMIASGFSEDVDKLRNIKNDGTGWLKGIEEEEKRATGIKNLKIGYNRVFGYYIEVPRSQMTQVPERYVRKQTLSGAERYVTEHLTEMESTLLGAQDKLCALEYALFNEIKDKVAENAGRLQTVASLLAETDVYVSLAEVACDNRYVCPEIRYDRTISVKEGRHPVVEQFTENGYFVPNDTMLDTDGNRLMLITGPNMAGKSTYMRQVALISVMAQIGSYVPAKEASLCIVDKVFTRVGASDDLASGQSTFMLEMSEVAHILKNATQNSLIVYDEVGRGTSTFDGMAIARAVAEYTLGKKIGAKTLFATHYHELTALENEFPGVVNYNIAAKKRGEQITFLRKIVKGATDDSYGIEVAGLAGVPAEVIRRAREILASVEAGEAVPAAKSALKAKGTEQTPDLLSAIAFSEAEEVAEEIKKIDLNTLSPIEAMNLLYGWKKILEK